MKEFVDVLEDNYHERQRNELTLEIQDVKRCIEECEQDLKYYNNQLIELELELQSFK